MDLRKVKKLIELVEESGIAELEVSSGDESVRISMPAAGSAVVSAPALVSQVASGSPPTESRVSGSAQIHAPMAGTFYRAPHPDAAAFVEEGQQINAGDVVCIIESMKMMHEIRAESSGRITRVEVENAQPINTGDVLFQLS